MAELLSMIYGTGLRTVKRWGKGVTLTEEEALNLKTLLNQNL